MGGQSATGRAGALAALPALAALAGAGALAASCATSPPPLPPPAPDGWPFQQAPAPAPGSPAAPPEAGGGGPARATMLPLAAEAPVRDERYGGWTFAADLLSLPPMLVWLSRPRDFYLALPMLTLSPLIHVAHQQMGNAAVSLLMRAAMLGAAYLVLQNLDAGCSGRDICIPLVGFVAFEAVVITPIALDGSLLARRSTAVPGWQLLPILPSVAMDGDGRRLFTLSARF